MNRGSDNHVTLPSLKSSGASQDAPADCPATDSVAHGTLEVLITTEPNGASSQSLRPDENEAVGIESHENTPAYNTGEETASVTVREQDSANPVAMELQDQTIKSDRQALPLDQVLVRQPEIHPFSQERLAAELKAIYAGLVMAENKCIEMDNKHMLPSNKQFDVTRYLLMIPVTRLILLQAGGTGPDGTVWTWFIKVQKHAIENDNKPSTLEPTKDLSATSTTNTYNLPTTHGDCPETPEPQVCKPEDYLHGFMVALELRAKELEWPEYEELTARTTAEIGEEGRNRAMDRKYFLDVGFDLVDQLVRDLETAKAKAEQEADHENKTPKEANPDVYIAPDEVAVIQQPSDQAANPSAQKSPAPPEETGVAPDDSGKDVTDIAQKAKSDSKCKSVAKRFPLEEDRPLHDKNLYQMIGREQWVLVQGQWTMSRNSEQWRALSALHRTLIHEHYDFFLASQCPVASPTIKEYAAKYKMPARMWSYAIHPFLRIMHERLFETSEFMNSFITLSYSMMSLLEETVPGFLSTWLECKADVARYRVATENSDIKVQLRWSDIAKEEFTRLLVEQPTTGRVYHHLAILEQPLTLVSPEQDFHATVSRLFYFTKSLVVEAPFYAARESIFTVIDPTISRIKAEAEKPTSVPQTDNDDFLIAVVHLILASMEPETLRRYGYKDSRKDHLQAVYAALKNIRVGGPTKTSRIRPSAKLGLLLCQLLLGIPPAVKRWSPMMMVWDPDLMTAEDYAGSNMTANMRGIHDATIELISTMIPYLLEEADTRDLGVWGFIFVILVFMRSLKTRPALLGWFGSAFHATILAPFLNMLLREDETRGDLALKRASHSELVTVDSLLNNKKGKSLGKYSSNTKDNIRTYHRELEERRKPERSNSTVTTEMATVTTEETAFTPKGTHTTAEEAVVTSEESTATTEEIATGGAAHKMEGIQTYANVLPEHFLLMGLFFAREAEPSDKSPGDPMKDAIAIASPPASGVTRVAAKAAGEPAVEQAQEEQQTEREVKEAEEAEVRRQKGMLRDPPIFPNGWFKKSKYNFDEMKVRDYVQDEETYDDRSTQILHLAAQLNGYFFDFKRDEEGRHWISAHGDPSIPKPDPSKKMPEILERDGGNIVYVHPSSKAVETEREQRSLARYEERRKEMEQRELEKMKNLEENNAEATTDVATTIDENARGDRKERPTQSQKPIDHSDAGEAPEAVNIPAGAPSMLPEDDENEPISSYEMELRNTAHVVKAMTAAENPSRTHDAEHTDAEVETPLPQIADDSQYRKASDAGPDAAAATVSAEDPGTDPPHATIELTKGVLEKLPNRENPNKTIMRWRAPSTGSGAEKGVEDDDGWTHVSDESYRDIDVAPTVKVAQVDSKSISHFFFW